MRFLAIALCFLAVPDARGDDRAVTHPPLNFSVFIKPEPVPAVVEPVVPARPVVRSPLVPTKPKVQPKPVPRPVIRPRPQVRESQHSHCCGRCGYVWTHGQSSFGNVQAHTCPKCGSGPWWQQASSMPSTISMPSIRNCPT